MKTFIKVFTVFLAAFFINSCGGGSDTGYIGTIFPANSKLASPNDRNAQEVIDYLIGYNVNGIIPSDKLLKNKKHFTVMNLILQELNRIKKDNLSKSKKLTDYSYECESGHLYEDKKGITTEYRYHECVIDEYEYNGRIIKKEYSNVLEIEYKTDFTIKSGYESIKVAQGSKIKLEKLNSNKFKITLNLITVQNGKTNGFENAVFIFDKSENSMYQTTGRIYINNLQEYVEYDSSYNMKYTPFIYDDGDNLIDGEVHYLMRGAKLVIYIEDGVANYSLE